MPTPNHSTKQKELALDTAKSIADGFNQLSYYTRRLTADLELLSSMSNDAVEYDGCISIDEEVVLEFLCRRVPELDERKPLMIAQRLVLSMERRARG